MELLQEQLRIITLRNRFLGKPNKIEEEIDFKRQTKTKVDNIEELKEGVKEWEFKSVKILQDLNYEKNDSSLDLSLGQSAICIIPLITFVLHCCHQVFPKIL